MRIRAGEHVVKVSPRKETILTQARSFIRAERSVLIAKQRNVCIIVIISVMQTMWISEAAARQTVKEQNARLLRRLRPVLGEVRFQRAAKDKGETDKTDEMSEN